MSDERSGPLQGIRVIDLSSVLMGPSSTQYLGDLGADVIAVEGEGGDRNRGMGPGSHPELSGIAMNLMRNKRSLAIDLKQPAGRAVFLDLARTADVMVTNLRPGPLSRLDLSYDVIRQVRPDIVFCQAAGFPSDGPRADAPAYDDIIQSASAVGDVFARAGHEPILAPTLIADKVAGMAIASAVLAALLHRERTGAGQQIEIPMIDVMRSFVLAEHGSGAIPDPPVREAGYPRILTPERRPQATSDGWINILPYDKEHYEAIFAAGGRDDLVADPRIQTRDGRYDHSDSLYRDIATCLINRSTDEWLDFCSQHAIPATRAATLDELVDGLPLADHPHAGPYRVIPPAPRFSATPAAVRRPAPLIGEHGTELLTELGYSPAELDRLRAAGVLFPRPES